MAGYLLILLVQSMPMDEQVILVDEQDKEIGTEEKLKAHLTGKLHRCFSIFIFNKEGEFLLQKRAKGKYHSGGLWSNACCGHPRPGEDTKAAAERRLKEEMGFDCALQESFVFTYKADLDRNIIEHEIDHVFFGMSDKLPVINLDEVASFKYVDLETLTKDIEVNPNAYTPWLRISLDQVIAHASTAKTKNGHTA